jgi:hypothetical protein
MVVFPPFESVSTCSFTQEGISVLLLIQSPLTSGLVIVYALGMELSGAEVDRVRLESFHKELSATQCRRLDSAWNWDSLLMPATSDTIIHPLFPVRSKLQRSFRSSLLGFRQRIENKVIFPHYTSKGVSSDTIQLLINKTKSGRIKKVYGNRATLHRHLKLQGVTSRDIVHHYMRTGTWILGYAQLKQVWTPNVAVPRTYFCWGGINIAQSTYLRNFFNDLADCFGPTHRHNRVQQDWLQRTTLQSMFSFYDLTSFTSWFHEQVSFLESLERFFSGTSVFLVSEGMTLEYHDIGSLIRGYIDWCNDFPVFSIQTHLHPLASALEPLFLSHLTAGFLGVPGNLTTCTLAHGLAVATSFDNEHSLQVPGDDVGFETFDDDHWSDVMSSARTLGVLQMEKVFRLPEDCLYLKRLVLDLGSSISLAPMLIYPLLPYLRDYRTSSHSNRFRLPERKKMFPRACSVLVSFMRDLWELTRGVISTEEAEIILLFLHRVHDMTGIPKGAIFQGQVYGVEGFTDLPDGLSPPLKFSIEDDDCILFQPDRRFAERYVYKMSIRITYGELPADHFSRLEIGDTIVVHNRKVWRFLEDMGYVEIGKIPGDVVTLVGSDARDAFLHARAPTLRRVRVLSNLEEHHLISLGIIHEHSDVEYASQTEIRSGNVTASEMTWRYGRYIDLDETENVGRYGRTTDPWKADNPSDSSDSDDTYMDY